LPERIAQSAGEALGLAQRLRQPPELGKRPQGVPEPEPEVDRLLEGGTGLREVVEGLEAVLEQLDGLPVGRAPGRLHAGLPAAGRRRLPHPGPGRVMGEELDVLRPPARVQPLDRAHHLPVPDPALVIGQAAVGRLVGEAVLEAIARVGAGADLVEELRGL
jgi:hypothetical protein